MVGILSEALIAELVLSLLGQPRRRWFVIAGSLGVAWAMAQPFVTNPLLFGRSLVSVWLNMLDQHCCAAVSTSAKTPPALNVQRKYVTPNID